MMSNSSALLTNLIKRGTARSQNIKINIVYSIGIKGVSIVTSFLMVPLTLNYLGTTDFGIWLTLSSIIAWFGFFDIGIGNGLRNKFTEAISLGDHKLAKTYVSTAYAGITLVMALLLIGFIISMNFINLNSLLKAPSGVNYNLNTLAIIVFSLFSLRMVLKMISTILLAHQRTALSSIFDPISNIIALLVIYLLTVLSEGSLPSFIYTVTIIPVIVFAVGTYLFFRNEYKDYRPSLRFIELSRIKELAGLSFRFFVIQIAVLVIFSTDNLIITRLFQPEDVTVYNIVFKYFNIITMGFAIVMTPMWSAYTEAYIKNDVQWIRSTNKKLVNLWFLIFGAVIFMYFIADWFYKLWVGDKITVPSILSIFMGLFILISTWNNIFVYFINGTGKIRLQSIFSVIAAFINIPISIYLARELGMGPSGVILGTCLCLLPGVALGPIQYYKILTKTDKGLWSQ